jgi:alginate O-acetyltransferase complex protein AlgI
VSFTSLHFLCFLPLVFFLHWLSPHRWRWLILLLASYYFYMSWNPWFGILLAGTSLIDWYAAMQIEKFGIRNSKFGIARRWLFISIISNLGCLAAFKYFAFLYNTFTWTSSQFSLASPNYIENLLVPAGLSFYVFHSLSYTIDVYRGKTQAEKHPGYFAVFVSFFPQLVAGPIARYNDLGVQFHQEKKWNPEWLVTGTRLALWGFFKKIAIADRLAEIVNPIFASPESFGGLTLLVAGFLFVVQIYCDFSGYSDIATGVARYFGYELTLNWRRPLLSTSLREFWSRNHISMTSWFRDYFYISIGGSRVNYTRWLFNIFLTFLISGLWHGPSWTFVIWGAMHGLVYLAELIVSGLISKFRIPNGRKPLGWLYLLSFHTISLIAFRAGNFHDLRIFYGQIFSFNFSLQQTLQELHQVSDYFPLALSFLLIVFLFLKELHEEKTWLIRFHSYQKWLRPAFYLLLFLLLFSIGQFNTNPFYYFSF